MYAKFTPQMKQTHTILAPSIVEPHFELMANVVRADGYKIEIISNTDPNIITEGLKSVHNDMCYPALLIIGQFIAALKSGKYDTHKVVLLVSQTGGGCRASNYINLLRKALEDNEFDYVPVISFNAHNLDGNALVLSKLGFASLLSAVFYSDLIMQLYNQSVPYEKEKGDSKKAYNNCIRLLSEKMNTISFLKMKKNYRLIIDEFNKIQLEKRDKLKVGLAGEIYMKYSPLANNNLEKYLLKEDVEIVTTGLVDFVLYCVYDGIFDREIYGKSSRTTYFVSKIVAKFLEKKQNDMIKAIKKYSNFNAPNNFSSLKNLASEFISHGVSMGEGWLMTAEIAEFVKSGVENVITAQPFGCLPAHIIARGMTRKIKDKFPNANIVTIDYDSGASKINQENRIKLMLANAKKNRKK